MTRNRKRIALIAVMAIGALIAALGAWAYYTAHTATSSPSAATPFAGAPASCVASDAAPAANTCTINTPVVTGGPLSPGGSVAISDQVNSAQNYTTVLSLASLMVNVTSTGACQTALTSGGTSTMTFATPGSSNGWFTLSGIAWNATTFGDGTTITGNAVKLLNSTASAAWAKANVTLNMVNSGTIDQSACQGSTFTVTVAL